MSSSGNNFVDAILASLDATRAKVLPVADTLRNNVVDSESPETCAAAVVQLVRARRDLRTALDRLEAMIDAYA